MRKALFLALLGGSVALPAWAGPAAADRLSRYFTSWYSVCPATKVTAIAASEIAIPGYEAYRVERHCELPNRNEMSVTLVDPSRDEVFVGEVLHSDARRNQPFAPAQDLPVLEAALKDVYGVPVSIALAADARGALNPIRVSLTESENATAVVDGFVSQDGASLLLGQFHPLKVDPAALRERLLAESSGVRPRKGGFLVTAFIDFQCEKCRQRTPRLRDFVWTHGGTLEVRFLPLVKVHDWAFPAAESAAGLANVSPALYEKFEEALFPRAEAMNARAARQLAADIADAAGARAAFDAEIASGRARDRVVRDIDLALSLGLNSTPAFFYRGAHLTAEKGLAENFIQSHLAAASKAPDPAARP